MVIPPLSCLKMLQKSELSAHKDESSFHVNISGKETDLTFFIPSRITTGIGLYSGYHVKSVVILKNFEWAISVLAPTVVHKRALSSLSTEGNYNLFVISYNLTNEIFLGCKQLFRGLKQHNDCSLKCYPRHHSGKLYLVPVYFI